MDDPNCKACFTCQKCVTDQSGRIEQKPQQRKNPQRPTKDTCLTDEKVKEIVLEILIETGLLKKKLREKTIDPTHTK